MSGKTTLSLTEYDLQILDLALRGYLDGLWDVDWDDDHVHMEQLRERIRVARARLARLAQAPPT